MAGDGDYSFLKPIDSVLTYPGLTVKKEYDILLKNGNKLPYDALICFDTAAINGPQLIYDYRGELMALYETAGDASLKPVKMFL